MIAIFGAAVVCLVILWSLTVHPIRSLLSIARGLCGIAGIILLLTALGRFWNGSLLDAGGLFASAVFLLWCTNKLSAPEPD